MDLINERWPREVFAALGVPGEILPGVVRAGTALGVVSAQAAAQTGIPQGTPVIAGHDGRLCGTDGCGGIERGKLELRAGHHARPQRGDARFDQGSGGRCVFPPFGRWQLAARRRFELRRGSDLQQFPSAIWRRSGHSPPSGSRQAWSPTLCTDTENAEAALVS